MKLSPMMQQYVDIKKEYSDCILFFRLGDFYEMFFEDAENVSSLLELTLTGKRCGLEERAPMCGVPYHSADTYISRLVEMGYKVAICEQLEDPSTTKGMVERGVTHVVTPGTVTSGNSLRENENSYIASAYLNNEGMSVAYCDITTGELCVTEKDDLQSMADDMLNELVRIKAKEVLISESMSHEYKDRIHLATGAFVREIPDSYYTLDSATDFIKAQFGRVPLTAIGIDGKNNCIYSLGALLSFILETQKKALKQITECRYYRLGNTMALDQATIRNLELTETLYDKNVKGSLLGVIDKTRTAMGSRKLKRWIREPLNNADEINSRLDAVGELMLNPIVLNDIREAFRQVYDFERISGKIASGTANGKDLIALLRSIEVLPVIRGAIQNMEAPRFAELYTKMDDLTEIETMISRAIVEEPPLTIKEGGLIKEGFSEELDELRGSISGAKEWISGLDIREKERTGITHLKVGYNKVFGYYIEVSRSNLDLVPDNYIRKQTLVGAERFVTPELKEMEGKVLNSQSVINKKEYELFINIRDTIEGYTYKIQRISSAISELDVLSSFAVASLKSGYVKPCVDNSCDLDIRQGRHPVVEQMTGECLFVPNSTDINTDDRAMLLITGPNMSGKSTYMRQTALIVIMAQIGCFVPAESARIGVVDRVFTRIGASDNLAYGQSTFFVEMSELAYILRNATRHSLIILDEIGRGTSTYDGLSIAWATVEYLCRPMEKIRTLFATHYHELTALEEVRRGVLNFNVDVSEEDGRVVFLHKIVRGSASRSYGIHVAKLAGVPEALLSNAEKKLERFEAEDGASIEVGEVQAEEVDREDAGSEGKDNVSEQMSFFQYRMNPVTERIKSLDLMNMTPAQAIAEMQELKNMIKEEEQ